jgi:hypothetical protein
MRVPLDSYEYGAPVSVYRAFALRNNIQFLIDECPQVRVNWCAAPDAPEFDADRFETDFTAVWTQDFEHTWIRPDYPTSLDVYALAVAPGYDSGTFTMRLRVVPASSPLNDLSVVPLVDLSASKVADGSGALLVIDEQVRFTDRLDQLGIMQQLSTKEGDFFRSPRVALMRVEVTLTPPPGTVVALTQCQLREFVCQS